MLPFPSATFPICYLSHQLPFPSATFPISYLSHQLPFPSATFPICYLSHQLPDPSATFPTTNLRKYATNVKWNYCSSTGNLVMATVSINIRRAAFSWRCVSIVLGFCHAGWTRHYLSSAHELRNDCIFVRSCNQNAVTVNMCLETGLFMGHVYTCYLAGVEDGYEHRTGLCTVKKKATLRLSSLTSGTT